MLVYKKNRIKREYARTFWFFFSLSFFLEYIWVAASCHSEVNVGPDTHLVENHWNRMSEVFTKMSRLSQSCWTCSRCQWLLWGTASLRACTNSLTSTPSRHRSFTRCITRTPTSCWGHQLALVKPLQRRWPCSASSTSIPAQRSVCFHHILP